MKDFRSCANIRRQKVHTIALMDYPRLNCTAPYRSLLMVPCPEAAFLPQAAKYKRHNNLTDNTIDKPPQKNHLHSPCRRKGIPPIVVRKMVAVAQW